MQVRPLGLINVRKKGFINWLINWLQSSFNWLRLAIDHPLQIVSAIYLTETSIPEHMCTVYHKG